MKVILNGKELQTQAPTLEALVAELQLPAQGVAVAVNNSIVKRTEWANQSLTEGSRITIIKAACGG